MSFETETEQTDLEGEDNTESTRTSAMSESIWRINDKVVLRRKVCCNLYHPACPSVAVKPVLQLKSSEENERSKKKGLLLESESGAKKNVSRT